MTSALLTVPCNDPANTRPWPTCARPFGGGTAGAPELAAPGGLGDVGTEVGADAAATRGPVADRADDLRRQAVVGADRALGNLEVQVLARAIRAKTKGRSVDLRNRAVRMKSAPRRNREAVDVNALKITNRNHHDDSP